MARFSMHTFLEDADDLDLAYDVAKGLGLTVTRRQGGKEEIIKESKTWVVPPQIIMIDLSSEQDTLQGLEDIASSGPEIDVNVIVVGNRDDVRLSRKLMGMGVVDYLLKPLEREDLVAALTSAMQNGEVRGSTIDPKRLVAVTGTSGGAGTSLIAATIASQYADKGLRTLLVDLDFTSGTQFILNGGTPSEGFRQAIQEPARVDNVYLGQMVDRTGSSGNLFMLSEPGLIDQAPDAGSLNAFFALLTNAFDMVVVDLPRHCEWGKPVLPMSSRIFCMTLPTIAGVKHAMNFSRSESRSLISESLIFVVNDVNGAKSEGIKLSDFNNRIEHPILSLPHDPVTCYREGQSEEVDLQAGKMKKPLQAVYDLLPSPETKKKNNSKAISKNQSLISGFMNWLKT